MTIFSVADFKLYHYPKVETARVGGRPRPGIAEVCCTTCIEVTDAASSGTP